MRWHGKLSIDSLALVVVSFLLLAYHSNLGLILSPDSGTYLQWSKDLFDSDISLTEWSTRSGRLYLEKFMYVFFLMLLAAIKGLTGSNWQLFALATNLMLMVGTLLIWQRILRSLHVNQLWIAFFLLIHLASVDHLVWPRYLLTDTLYCFFVAICIWAVFTHLEQRSIKTIVFVFGGLIILAFTRPTAAPLLAAIGFGVTFSRVKPKTFFRSGCIAILVTWVIGLTMIARGIYLYDSENASGILAFAVRHLSLGEVVNDRPDTWLSPPSTFLEVIGLILWRFIYFFIPTHANFSMIHNALNCIIGLTVVAGFGTIVKSFWMKNSFSKPEEKFLVLLVICIISVASFHSFILIDYDWRYRWPIIDLMLVLAVVGFSKTWPLHLRCS